MKNIGSEHPFPAGLPSVFTPIDQGGKAPQANGQLLELRTEDGPVFVRPSKWQRMRLRRAFRYFHVVPPQLLSSRHRRLITKLLRTAVVIPDESVANDGVFGVVQNVHANSPLDGPQFVVKRPEPARTLAFLPSPAIQIASPPEKQTASWDVTSPAQAFVVRDPGLWPWIVSGAAAAALIPLIMASVYGISQLSGTPKTNHAQRAATPPAQVATDLIRKDVPAATMPFPVNRQTRKQRPAAKSLPAAPQDAETPTAQPLFVSELPPGYFAHPVVTTPNLVGEVRLKALVGADGTVKRVTVLSGNPKLARAALRAVKQWHYSPYQVLGDAVAVETGVRISFFGADAVSIASLSDAPAPQAQVNTLGPRTTADGRSPRSIP